MATTKLFAIKTTEVKALAYIANPQKTDGGRLIYTFGCSTDPAKASKDFDIVRAGGTGKSIVLSQHLIQSFKPGEITPERALEIGKELCEKFLKNEYQYFLAVHTDTDHIHLHCIFNNVSRVNGKTFETNMNQGSVKERAWKKLIDLSDEICRGHHLSVIEHRERTTGKSHWEWEMNRQGLSWKAKLKYAIDQVIKASDSFEDFLERCRAEGILVEYNPDHKIDLKFMLAEQRENNPRARFTRARTLGWFYETEQIHRRIAMYSGTISYTPRTRIRRTDQVQDKKFLRDYLDRANMKQVSKALNLAAKYGIEPDDIGNAALTAFVRKGKIVEERNRIDTQIEDLKIQVKVLKKYRTLSGVAAELKTLSGRQAQKFRKEHSAELNEHGECQKQILEWYPDGHIPSVELAEKKIHALEQERERLKSEYAEVKTKAKELGEAQRDIDEFLRQEREAQEQDRKRKKNGDLE